MKRFGSKRVLSDTLNDPKLNFKELKIGDILK